MILCIKKHFNSYIYQVDINGINYLQIDEVKNDYSKAWIATLKLEFLYVACLFLFGKTLVNNYFKLVKQNCFKRKRKEYQY